MPSDSGAAHGVARLLYPELPDPLTPADLHRLYTPSYDERNWARTVARTPLSQVVLLVQLATFQAVGRFLPVEDIPASAIEQVARRLAVECDPHLVYAHATLYRHHDAILQYLGVQPWGPVARELAEATMRNTAQARTNLADLINAAVDALVRHRFELPALIALRRLAGTAHSTVNATQWREIGARLDERDRSALETLLVVDPTTQESPVQDQKPETPDDNF